MTPKHRGASVPSIRLRFAPALCDVAPGTSLSKSLRQFPVGSAHAAFLEKSVGSLTPGRHADFVILSADPTNLNADQIRKVKAEKVFLAGQCVSEMTQ